MAARDKPNKPTIPARLDVHIHPETKQRLLVHVAASGESQGSVVDAALRDYLDSSSLAILTRHELGELRGATARMERNLETLDASLAGFVQMWLAYHPPLPEEQKAPAQVMAEKRFAQFVRFLQGQLRQRKNFIAQLAENGLLGDGDIRALLDMEAGD